MRFTRWDQEASTESTNEVLFHLAFEHLSRCNGDDPQTSDIFALLAARDIMGLCSYELSYTSTDVQTSRHLRQILAFFQKRKDLKIGVNPTAVAWETARKAEMLCGETNTIFRKVFQGGFYFPLDVESVLYRAQCKIASILGSVPDLSGIPLHFGPGATTQVKKKDASARRKLSQMMCCSEEMVSSLGPVLSEMPLWAGASPSTGDISCPVSIDRGKIDFVPKSAKTDRTISVEPMLNSMVQLGIGEYIAKRLRREGVDISDQTRNQRMAKEGSTTGDLATLDLSSASDTVSIKIVESLLPIDWFLFLSRFRTGVGVGPDGPLRLEKFSSMGNGFTFPLETLIFYALSLGCVDECDHAQVSVYGDDIIVPTYAYNLLVKVLHCSGFIVNQRKSFSQGPFRESCGKDYYKGIDIRPCYIKGPLSGESCFVLHNFYVRTGQPEFALLIRELLDESLVIFGPDGYGDGHLLGDFKPKPTGREKGWSGFTFETYTWRPKKVFYKRPLSADYVYPSYSIYVRGGDESLFTDEVEKSVLGTAFGAKLVRRKGLRTGALRPQRSASEYRTVDGRAHLVDTIPGVDGYKRIKIYIFSAEG